MQAVGQTTCKCHCPSGLKGATCEELDTDAGQGRLILSSSVQNNNKNNIKSLSSDKFKNFFYYVPFIIYSFNVYKANILNILESYFVLACGKIISLSNGGSEEIKMSTYSSGSMCTWLVKVEPCRPLQIWACFLRSVFHHLFFKSLVIHSSLLSILV